jgi:hypothetical protein
MEPVTLVILVVVALIVLAIGFVGVPYLKAKGIINEQNTQTTLTLLNLIETVSKSLNLGDKTKTNIETIFGVTEKVVQYVEQTMTNETNDAKKKYAVDTTIDILKQLGIEVSVDNVRLIELGIESAVSVLEKTYK